MYVSVCLSVCQVSNAGGELEVSTVSEENPFSQQALQSSECYLLDSGSSGTIFIWKGTGGQHPQGGSTHRGAAPTGGKHPQGGSTHR